jgi:hypothetical protein
MSPVSPASKPSLPIKPEPLAVTGVDWALLALVSLLAFGAGVLEVLLVPLYVGSVIVPVSVVAAVVSNIGLPWLGFVTVRVPAGALIPVVSWLVPVFGLIAVSRPEGDILVSGVGAQEWNYYVMILLGCFTGMAAFIRSTAAFASGSRGGSSSPDRSTAQ